MFKHMMGNDPRPTYFHQTNIMDQSAGTVTGDACHTRSSSTETAEPRCWREYNAYFASNAPVEQLTMAQIGTCLTSRPAWAAANASQISGYIDGNVVTVNNNGAATEMPLTGTTVGTPYAGTQSGWTNAPTGTQHLHGARGMARSADHPGHPDSADGSRAGRTVGDRAESRSNAANRRRPTAAPLYYVAVQVAPKKVSMKKGTATVSLKCEAKNGKAAKNHFCTGSFTLKVMGKKVTHSFKIKATKTARIVVTLPKNAMAAAASREAPHAARRADDLDEAAPRGAEGRPRDVEHQDVSSVSKRD